MSINDIRSDLLAIERRKCQQQIKPYDKTAAVEFLADSRASFRRVTLLPSINPSVVERDVVETALQSYVELKRFLSEIEPETPEVGYVDGYIYGIVVETEQLSPLTGCIKIGKSIDPTKREKSSKTWLIPMGIPREVFRIWVQGYSRIEADVHDRLNLVRIHPEHEWFRCTLEDAVNAVFSAI
jgi:hypothetical protein